VRFLVTHPPDPRPALVVETTPRVDSEAIASLKETLQRLGCPNGLLFDEDVCAILRDTYASLGVDSLAEDGSVATDRLLARVANGRALEQRVFDWLRSMAASWNDALPAEQDVAAPFIMDIVPAVSGSSILQVA
jgi:hypothetical protein